MERENSLRLSLLDAFLYSLMIGVGETYLPAYCLSVGMGETFAGLLASLPIVSGAFLQLITPQGLEKMRSHKNWVVASASLQALTFVPLVYFTLTSAPDFWMLFLVLTLYWGSGFAAGPAWNYWMGRLIQVEQGSAYLAKRAQVSQLGILLGLVLGGVALHNKMGFGPFISVFSLLFVLAFVARVASSFLLSRQHFKTEWSAIGKKVSIRESWKIFWRHPAKRKFFLLLIPFQASVFITAPFVPPYMLAKAEMDYGTFMLAVASLFIGKIISLEIVNRLKGRVAGQKIFLFGAMTIAPLPMAWAFSSAHHYIFILQFISGMAWACVEVGLAIIFFNDLAEDEKVPVVTFYNFINSVAIIVGTFIGGRILWTLGESMKAYYVLFFVGGFMRLLFAGPLASMESLRTQKTLPREST